MSDWLARRLAARQGQPPTPPQGQPQYGQPPYPPPGAPQTVAPGYAPQGYAPNRVAAPQVPSYPAPGQPPTSLPSPNEIPRHVNVEDPYDTMVRAAAARGEVQRTWAGGPCPECHQDTVYQPTTNESGYPLRFPPAPTCTNCGWPRMQAGSLHGGATALKPQGRARPARQLTNHVVTVDWDGMPAAFEPQQGGSAYV
jgi:hypothetical protein